MMNYWKTCGNIRKGKKKSWLSLAVCNICKSQIRALEGLPHSIILFFFFFFFFLWAKPFTYINFGHWMQKKKRRFLNDNKFICKLHERRDEKLQIFVEIWDDKVKVRIPNVGGMKLLFSPKLVLPCLPSMLVLRCLPFMFPWNKVANVFITYVRQTERTLWRRSFHSASFYSFFTVSRQLFSLFRIVVRPLFTWH